MPRRKNAEGVTSALLQVQKQAQALLVSLRKEIHREGTGVTASQERGSEPRTSDWVADYILRPSGRTKGIGRSRSHVTRRPD